MKWFVKAFLKGPQGGMASELDSAETPGSALASVHSPEPPSRRDRRIWEPRRWALSARPSISTEQEGDEQMTCSPRARRGALDVGVVMREGARSTRTSACPGFPLGLGP